MTSSDPFATPRGSEPEPAVPGLQPVYERSSRSRTPCIGEGAQGAAERLTAFGALTGSAQMLEQGRLANENPPRLRTFDTKGHRIDRVEFHPSYHAMMAMSTGQGLHMASWDHLRTGGEAPASGANVARAAGSYMAAQTESGHCCPITMTNAAVASLLIEPSLADDLLPKILVRDYDPSFRPIPEKRAITIGMGMTEKQGGTDVRTNSTRAEPIGGEHGLYAITGHKWFMSAPMSDAFLMLAQAPGGLSCFFVPRLLPDGTVNPIHIQRLKDKLGNKSNASSEVELHNVTGWLDRRGGARRALDHRDGDLHAARLRGVVGRA